MSDASDTKDWLRATLRHLVALHGVAGFELPPVIASIVKWPARPRPGWQSASGSGSTSREGIGASRFWWS